MRSFLTFFSVILLATPSVFGSPVPECTAELCGNMDFSSSLTKPVEAASSLVKTDTPARSTSESEVEVLTNAQRLSRGLPLKKPKLIQGSPVRRVQASPAPDTSHRGYIQVNRADGTGTLGYISKSSVGYGLTRYQSDVSNAMVINFKLPYDQIQGQMLEFTFESFDSAGGFQYLGLVQGRDDTNSDMAVGSFHYLYIAATGQTAPSSPPGNPGNSYSQATGLSRTSESAIWSFDGFTNAIGVQWVNTDGSKPRIYTWTQSTALYAGADSAQFSNRYPAGIVPLTFKFVPI